jgi:hypothetical protein
MKCFLKLTINKIVIKNVGWLLHIDLVNQLGSHLVNSKLQISFIILKVIK